VDTLYGASAFSVDFCETAIMDTPLNFVWVRRVVFLFLGDTQIVLICCSTDHLRNFLICQIPVVLSSLIYMSPVVVIKRTRVTLPVEFVRSRVISPPPCQFFRAAQTTDQGVMLYPGFLLPPSLDSAISLLTQSTPTAHRCYYFCPFLFP